MILGRSPALTPSYLSELPTPNGLPATLEDPAALFPIVLTRLLQKEFEPPTSPTETKKGLCFYILYVLQVSEITFGTKYQ